METAYLDIVVGSEEGGVSMVAAKEEEVVVGGLDYLGFSVISLYFPFEMLNPLSFLLPNFCNELIFPLEILR